VTQSRPAACPEAIALEAFGLLGARRQVSPFSSRYEGFCLDEAYDVVERVRQAERFFPFYKGKL
jgi:hypothetical protein